MTSNYNSIGKHDWIKSLFYSAIIAGAMAAYSTIQSVFSVSGLHFTAQDVTNIVTSFGVSFGGCIVAFIKTNSQGHILTPEPQEQPSVQQESKDAPTTII